MSDEIYSGNIPFRVMEIDTGRIFSKASRIVSIRLVTDSRTGKPGWFAHISKNRVIKAIEALNLKIIIGRSLDLLNWCPVFWKKAILIMTSLTMFGSSFSLAPASQTRLEARTPESELDREIRLLMEKGINLEERRRQVPAIATIFARRTDPQRSRWLAALCYLKTLGTPFMPLDIAEIALAETGEFGLSGTAVSPRGALGVWQLMPHRAKSHGYSPTEMKNDEKCAEAAVRELTSKLQMAKGDLAKAKRFYCGAGPEADAYEVKIRQFKREIMRELARMITQGDKNQLGGIKRLS